MNPDMKRYYRLKDLGICVMCGKAPVESGCKCPECRDNCNKKQLERRQKARDRNELEFSKRSPIIGEIRDSGGHYSVYAECPICHIPRWIDSLSDGTPSNPNRVCTRCKSRWDLPKGEAALNKTYRQLVASAKQGGRNLDISKEEYRSLCSRECFYCGSPPSNLSKARYGDLIYNGLDRIDNSKGYSLDNVVTCCIKCNRAKDVMTQEEFIVLCHEVSMRHHRG